MAIKVKVLLRLFLVFSIGTFAIWAMNAPIISGVESGLSWLVPLLVINGILSYLVPIFGIGSLIYFGMKDYTIEATDTNGD